MGRPTFYPAATGAVREQSLSLLLLDPPYPNASVTRNNRRNKHKEAYSPVQDLYDLWKLKDCIAKLLRAGSDQLSPTKGSSSENGSLLGDAPETGTLVACWVTNDVSKVWREAAVARAPKKRATHLRLHHRDTAQPKARHFMLQKLFNAWNVIPIGEIGWLKVTASPASTDLGSRPASSMGQADPSDDVASSHAGELVISAEMAGQAGRKSHEILLLGRCVGALNAQSAEERASRIQRAQNEACERAQARTVIMSVPLGHSRKPYVLGKSCSWATLGHRSTRWLQT